MQATLWVLASISAESWNPNAKRSVLHPCHQHQLTQQPSERMKHRHKAYQQPSWENTRCRFWK